MTVFLVSGKYCKVSATKDSISFIWMHNNQKIHTFSKRSRAKLDDLIDRLEFLIDNNIIQVPRG